MLLALYLIRVMVPPLPEWVNDHMQKEEYTFKKKFTEAVRRKAVKKKARRRHSTATGGGCGDDWDDEDIK